jgi:TolB protein
VEARDYNRRLFRSTPAFAVGCSMKRFSSLGRAAAAPFMANGKSASMHQGLRALSLITGMNQSVRALLAGTARACALGFICAAASVSSAQMRIDVTGVGAALTPIAIADFQQSDPRLKQQVAQIIRSNFSGSGLFRLVDSGGLALGSSTPIDHVALRNLGADWAVGGAANRFANGQVDISYRLTDAVRRQEVVEGKVTVRSEADLRLGAHRVSDLIYERITGNKGIFATRIAFVTRQGERYRLIVSDWDGGSPVVILTSAEPIISPSWSPDGMRLAYVSFEDRKPVVYVQTLEDGKRQAVANFRGSNSAPAWSPDGSTLAVALTRDGLSQIYLIPSMGGRAPSRLTSSSAIDTEPVYSPDGRFIYFTSDRGGSPQIYRIEAQGGAVNRVTFGSPYNVSPRISPDGRLLAYVSRRDGKYLVVVRDLASGSDRVLSDGGTEESPSFAPNSRWVMYATRSRGRDSLVAATVDGRQKLRLSSSAADIREPTWGPLQR